MPARSCCAGAVFAWNAVRQEREFRRLIAAGDAALTRDQTYEAIEAFSGALALKHDSMLAYLKRGDSYRRRGELSAALRDLARGRGARPDRARGRWNCWATSTPRWDATSARPRSIAATSALDDRAPHVLYKLALAYYRNGQTHGRHRAAAPGDRARRSIRRSPLPAGDVPEAQKHTPEAMASLTRALELNPAFGVGPRGAADLDLAHGRPAKASSSSRRSRRSSRRGRSGSSTSASRTRGWERTRRRDHHARARRRTLSRGRRRLHRARTCLARIGGSADDRVALSKALEALERGGCAANASSDTLRCTAVRCSCRVESRQPSESWSRRRDVARRVRSRSSTCRMPPNAADMWLRPRCARQLCRAVGR